MDGLLFILALAFLVVVGHLLWLAAAAVVRFLSNALPAEQPATPSRKNAIDPDLLDLEITTRTIRQLLARGDLDPETAERVEQCLQARRRTLQPKPIVPTVRPVRAVPASSLAQLEQLLNGQAHPRDLSPERRREALACYRCLNNNQRAALKGLTLLAAARLLEMAGMTSHALNAYRRLLDEAAELPNGASIALEAARLAIREGLAGLARRFLNAAVAGVLPESEYQEVQTLRRRLEGATQAPGSLAAVEPRERAEAPSVTAAVQAVPMATPTPDPLAVVPAPPRPRRSLTNVLAGFMEARNILWGELAGGLLIVGCSIALVITLWHSLEELPYFPFLIFASITAALFVAGEYTLHHWKLESTSRGLLVIALLLVPLNLLVLADPTLGHAGAALDWTFKSIALLLSLGMVRLAGRDLIGVGVLPGPIDRRWLFVLAIVGAASSQFLVPRWLDDEHPLLFVVLGCVPVACHLLACGAVVAGLARARARLENQLVEVRQANALFVFLGLSSFALFVALGYLLSRSIDVVRALPRLAEPFALAGVPILAGGLLVRRGLPREEAGPRTAGIALAFTGLALMLSAVVLAWPLPLPLLLVCLSNAAILSVLAFRWRLPSAHAVALPCLTLAVLLLAQFALGNLAVSPEGEAGAWLAEQLTSPASGLVLASLMVLLAGGAESLLRFDQRGHADSYALGCGVLGVGAVLTTACHGIESPGPAALVFALAASCALALHVRWRRAALPYTGLGLFVAASLWSLWAAAPDHLALWGFVLALEAAALALAATAAHPLRRACAATAVCTAVLAVGLAVITPAFPAQGLHTGTAALLALTMLLLAQVFRISELVWLASAFLFAAVAHLLIWDLGDAAPERPLLMALLVHATLALLGARLLQSWSAGDGSIVRLPLQYSAVLSSLLTLPLLLVPGVAALALAGYTLWLAVLWLFLAAQWRSPAWFSAFQLAVSAAVVFAVRAALPGRDWFDPYSLQAYGIGLGLLAVGWIAARMALSDRASVRELWEAPWPAVDRLMLGALVIGQFALALWGILPGVDAELIPAGFVSVTDWPSSAFHAYGSGAWTLLGALAFVLLLALREKGRSSILVGLLVLAATAPLLAAGPFAAELATASALRWGLALCYLACSALVWRRRELARLADSTGVRFAPRSTALVWPHALLSILAASVFLLTMQVAVLGFSGLRPSGPGQGSIFAEMGWSVSHVIPLLLLTVGLVGHALRERSPVYAFLAGLVANVSVTGGYALGVVTSGRYLDIADLVCLVQLASLTAALWSVVWQASGRWVAAWREMPAADGYVPAASAAPLMRVQIVLALIMQVLLILFAVISLSGLNTVPPRWPVAAGSLLGWLALLASLTALFMRYTRRQRPLPWEWLFGGGLALATLLACSAERIAPQTGFYFLLLGWPLYVLLWSLLPLLIRPMEDRSWLSFAGFKEWTSVLLLPCFAAVWWALNAAVIRQEYLWAAAAVSLCSLASALFAAWRRSAEQAFLAGLCANVAASLLIWRWYHPLPPAWLVVVRINVIASSLAALLWLGVRRWLGESTPKPLLIAQAMLGLLAHTLLLLWPLLHLAGEPGVPLSTPFAGVGSPLGWTALLLSALAAYCQFAVTMPRGRIHVVGIAGLSAGILSACTATAWDAGDWRAFHVLLMAWCVFGLLAAVVGSVAVSARPSDRFRSLLAAPELHRWLEGIGLAILLLTLPHCGRDPLRPIFPAVAVFTVSVLAAMLALWTRQSAYVWISGLLLDVVGLLFWSAWGTDTIVGFLLTNALGLAAAATVWIAVGLTQASEEYPSIALLPHRPFSYAAAKAALALVVLVVLVLLGSDMAPPRIVVSSAFAWITLAAVGAALGAAFWDRGAAFAPPCLYVLGLAAVGLTLHEWTHSPSGLGWSAALALAGYTILAAIIAFVLQRSPPPWFPLLWHGLPTMPLAWTEGLQGGETFGRPAVARSGDRATTGAVARSGDRATTGAGDRATTGGGDRATTGCSSDRWFLPAQALVACVAASLSLWMCLNFAALVDRLAGPAAVLLLLPAAACGLTKRLSHKVVAARFQRADVLDFPLPGTLEACRHDPYETVSKNAKPQTGSRFQRPVILVLGAMAAAEIAWACPDPSGFAPWLHRNVLLLTALATMTVLYGVGLPRWLAHDVEWVRVARRFGPLLGVLAALTLLVLLMQEFRLYDAASRRTPMLWPEILVIVAALLALMVSGIRFAVVPGRDPFGLSERGRSLYVYAVELLLVLLFLHIRLNVPELFRGWGAKYWTFLVMLIAFVGVGLSEFFERRKLRVLAAPLQRTGVFLPLLPLLAFWAKPPAPLLHFADAHAPGLRPLLGYLDKLPQHFDSYAFLWLLVCGLYGLVSLTRRSFVFAVLAALAANVALWSMLTHHSIAFLVHPQCWLIPPALILLAAEYVSRDRLRPELSAALRYLGMCLIYVSSTADLFLAGLGESIALPIVLAVLSLAGMLLGILLRVRAFLFLGISFLFLDVGTMIWFAAVDRYQTWIWWVSGIVLGAAILTLFAIFEKRRNDILQLLEEIKHWD